MLSHIIDQKPSRKRRSLEILAKKIIYILKNLPGYKFNVDKLAIMIGVQKRRMYDVTNILETMGFM